MADFTYIWTHEGWLFVAVVLDLYSRRVVGWPIQATMTAQLVTDAMLMAIWRRTPSASLLHHSDQGSQYSSEQFQRVLTELGVVCSMSRAGNVWDNAVMESFFSTMKIERCHRSQYHTRDQARADIFKWVFREFREMLVTSGLGRRKLWAAEVCDDQRFGSGPVAGAGRVGRL